MSLFLHPYLLLFATVTIAFVAFHLFERRCIARALQVGRKHHDAVQKFKQVKDFLFEGADEPELQLLPHACALLNSAEDGLCQRFRPSLTESKTFERRIADAEVYIEHAHASARNKRLHQQAIVELQRAETLVKLPSDCTADKAWFNSEAQRNLWTARVAMAAGDHLSVIWHSRFACKLATGQHKSSDIPTYNYRFQVSDCITALEKGLWKGFNPPPANPQP